MSIVILITIIWVLPNMRGTTLYISLFLLALGLILMLYNTPPIQVWLDSLRINLTLVSIFIVVPLLGIPVKTGGYVIALKTLFSRQINKPTFLYLGTNILTHFLSVVVNIGSISIASELTKGSDIENNKLIANSINRGYIMAIFWSPYFSSMALVLAYLPIEWSSLLIYSFGLIVITIFLSIILDWKEIKKNNQKEAIKSVSIPENDLKIAKKKVLELAVYLILITGVVLLAEALITSVTMVFMVALASLILPFLWSLGFKRLADYKEGFKSHIYEGLPRIKKEIILFLVAGFFSGAFINANLGSLFVSTIQNIFGSFYIGTAYFICTIIFTAALIGIHPIVFITVLVTSVQPEMIGFSPEYFALLLLFSFGISNTISPSTAVNNLLANLLNEKLINVSLRWNIKFALILILFTPIYLTMVKV